MFRLDRRLHVKKAEAQAKTLYNCKKNGGAVNNGFNPGQMPFLRKRRRGQIWQEHKRDTALPMQEQRMHTQQVP